MNRSEQIRNAIPRLSELDRIALESALHDELDQRCGEVDLKPVAGCPGSFEASETSGVLFFLQNLTCTFDDHWMIKGTPAQAPFPKLGYLRHLFGSMQKLLAHPELKRDVLFVAKSRNVMCSWSVMAMITHMCMWRPQTFWICQSSKEDKAAELLKMAHALWHNSAEWVKERHPLEVDNLLDMRFKNGSRILGLPAGPDQIRIFHPWGVFFDEAAFLPGFEDSLNAVLPVAAQVIAVSTAAPSRFMDLCDLETSNSNWQSATAEIRKDQSAAFTGPETMQHAAPDPTVVSAGGASIGTGGVRHFRDGMPEVHRG